MSGFPPLAVRSMKEGEAWSSAGWVPMQGWQGQKEELTGALFLFFSFSPTTRWSMLVPAFLTHACLGAPYGWSAVTSALTREQGVVVSAAGDWGLDLATYPMTIMIGPTCLLHKP